MKVVRLLALHTDRLYPQKCSWYSFSEGMSQKNPVTPPGIDPGTVRIVAQRLNHYATPGPIQIINIFINYVRNISQNTVIIHLPTIRNFEAVTGKFVLDGNCMR